MTYVACSAPGCGEPAVVGTCAGRLDASALTAEVCTLARKVEGVSRVEVQLAARPEVRHGAVVAALDGLEQAGFWRQAYRAPAELDRPLRDSETRAVMAGEVCDQPVAACSAAIVRSDPKSASRAPKLVLSVAADGALVLGNRVVAIGDLAAAMEKAKGERSMGTRDLALRADGDLPAEMLTPVLDAVRKAGFEARPIGGHP